MTKGLTLDRFRILSSSMLKLIAVITMFIDHSALLLAPEISLMTEPFFTVGSQTVTLYYLMRKIGRISFPIFCFLITEGFSHTRSKKRYAFNLLLFAVISEIPFNIMKSGQVFNLKVQNVFFTLFSGVLMLYVFENARTELFKAVLLTAVALVAIFLKCDYGLPGVLLILLMYVLKKHPAVQAVLAYPLLSGGFFAWLAFIPINMYNGKRGFIKSGFSKYAFYAFYPLHILILVAIKLVLMKHI